MSEQPVTGKRQYRMAARAEAKAATRTRILDAAESCADELLAEEVTLAVVGKRAGVSVQTILRHFGSREDLFLATVIHMGMKMSGDRDIKPSWETERIVAVLVDHYERFGSRVLWGLAQEHRHPQIKQLTDYGRVYHGEWCEEAFAPALKGMRGARRKRAVAQLVAATDIYVWKILRRDRQLSPTQVKLAIVELLETVTEPRP
jgi:AcrR family transcriptional regulator